MRNDGTLREMTCGYAKGVDGINSALANLPARIVNARSRRTVAALPVVARNRSMSSRRLLSLHMQEPDEEVSRWAG